MKIYRPTDIFTFGKYKNEKLDFVFTFHPEYIEWLILNNDFFVVDIELFMKLHTFPFAEECGKEAKYYNSISLSVNGEHRICSLREYLTEFMDLYETEYLNPPVEKKTHKFSDLIISKNKLKIDMMKKKKGVQDYSQERRQSYDDWLREEFGDDAGTAYWNTH